ncbi:MAG: hypothetical protein MUP47_10805 [Phycisphaerae bacterium]|nr:hypothetical protein [Phycisphaerae bacterium]
MSISVRRAASGDIHGLNTAEQMWVITGTADENEALEALCDDAPMTIPKLTGYLVRKDVQVEAVFIDPARPERCSWRGRAIYQSPDVTSWHFSTRKTLGSKSIRGSTRAGTMHVKRSLSTVGAYGTGATAGDNDGFIGLKPTSEGGVDIEGADMVTRGCDFQVLAVYATGSYPSLGAIYALSGCTNSGPVTITDSETGLTISAAIGELLYHGGDFGDKRDDGGLEWLHHFSMSPNATGLIIGDITGIAKKGWEYLWARHREEPNETLGLLAPKAVAAYVERMYPSASFAPLGLT